MNVCRITALSKQKIQPKNQLNALKPTVETPTLAIDQTEQLVDILEATTILT